MILNFSLIYLFSLTYILCSVTKFSNEKISTFSINLKSPEEREEFVKLMLDTKKSLGTLPEKSVFEDTNEIIANVSGISVSEQHFQCFKALCDYIKKICSKALIDISTGFLTLNDRDVVLQKIFISAYEFNFAKRSKFFDFFENVKVVRIMLELLAKLDPLCNESRTRVSVLKLSQFCVSNDCLDIFFSIIFKSLESSHRPPMPVFMLNSKIKDTSKIDQYFRSCVDLMNTSLTQQILPVPLAITIVESPFSIESTKIFMKLINNEELFIQFVQLNLSENNLVFRLIKSKEIDNFMKLCTTNLCARNAAVKTLKNVLKLRKLELELIDKIIKPDQDILKLSLTDIEKCISSMNFDENVMASYYKIDPVFIEELIQNLDQKIQRVILILNNLTDPTEKYIYLTLAYFFARLIPIYHSDFLPRTSYEPLLDFKLEIEKKGERCNLPYSVLIKTLSLPYVEVTLSGLEKIWSIIKSDFEGNESLMICSATTILSIRSSNNSLDTAELFKILFFFFQSHQIDFSLVARILIQDFSETILFDILTFCKQHGMFSKAEIFFIERCLKNLNYGQDFSSLKAN